MLGRETQANAVRLQAVYLDTKAEYGEQHGLFMRVLMGLSSTAPGSLEEPPSSSDEGAAVDRASKQVGAAAVTTACSALLI